MALVLLVSAKAWAAPPAAVDRCIAAAEHGQTLRAAGKYRDARVELQKCLASDCPTMMRDDCTRFLAELSAATPTVIFHVTDGKGALLQSATVRVDGFVVRGAVDQYGHPFDPGAHDVQVELDGYTTWRTRMTLEPGANRLLDVVLVSTAPPPPPQATTEGKTSSSPTTATSVIAIAAGATSLLAFGTFAAVGLSADRDYDKLERSCAPSCAKDEVDSIHTRYQVADIALVSGIVLAAGAVVVYLFGPREPRRETARSNVLSP